MRCASCQAEHDAGVNVCPRCGRPSGPWGEGSVIAGRYEIRRTLGKGGMGVVHEAFDRSLGETVALKVLRSDVAVQPEARQRFINEIRLARRVRHRNVCGIHEYGEDAGRQYIAMTFVDGVDLKHWIRERGPLPEAEAFEAAIAAADGLQAIHDEGILHRDLKTANITRDQRGVVRLMDFGIAKDLEALGGLTAAGMILGTPEYMSPEHARNEPLDFRTDIYALGIVVFEFFTGAVPFSGTNSAATLYKHVQEPPPLDQGRGRLLPAALRPVLAKALAKAPFDRYPSAREFAEALRQAHDQTVNPKPRARAAVAPRGADRLPEEPPVTSGRVVWLGVFGVVIALALLTLLLIPALPWPGVEPHTALDPLPPPFTIQSSAPAAEMTATPAPTPELAVAADPLTDLRLEAGDGSASSTPPSATGLLVIRVVPFADITINGQPYAPGRIPLPEGRYVVRLEHPDYLPLQRTLTVRGDKATELAIDFSEDGLRRK